MVVVLNLKDKSTVEQAVYLLDGLGSAEDIIRLTEWLDTGGDLDHALEAARLMKMDGDAENIITLSDWLKSRKSRISGNLIVTGPIHGNTTINSDVANSLFWRLRSEEDKKVTKVPHNLVPSGRVFVPHNSQNTRYKYDDDRVLYVNYPKRDKSFWRKARPDEINAIRGTWPHILPEETE